MRLRNTVSKILVVKIKYSIFCPPRRLCLETSVAELHHFYAAPALVENFDAAPALAAPAPALLYSKAKFVKRTKV
jgi:hypothetical protein